MSVVESGRVGQLTPHHAERVDLPGRHGPIAALRTPGAADATVLLVPGYTGSKEDFAPLLDPIAAAGLRAVAIDLPGQYESPGPDDESAYLPGPLGEEVAELVGTFDGPVVLLGHSYGGLVARGAVLAGAPIAGLTLLDSGPRHLPRGMRWDALSIGEPLLRADGLAAAYVEREKVSARFPVWALLPAELKDFFRARFLASAPAALLGMAQGLRTEPDRVDALAEALAGRPRLVAAGENDDAWHVPEQREMARRLDAPFALVPGAAHSPNIENPAGLLEVLLPAWRSWR
ncbi:alpha/beta fold hydrolase [Amycolatopsis anabasis]|uniref:alpha/beta fold hydrolase n=1 Tax=Amycolatopsis anabasis TaxID=1840409 RepID=UPI00131E44DF|nr:alpha/beta hydrolase [Amycolatopsis anabasis]